VTIVYHAHRPKRPKRRKPLAPPPSASIVTTKKPGPRKREPEVIDPEVEAEVKAWFAKNIRPPGA
jgi:hypothetical protein